MGDPAVQLSEVLGFCPKDCLLLPRNYFLLYDLPVIFITPMVEKNPT